MPNLTDLRDEILGILKESAGTFFDKEEDLASLKEVAQEMAILRFKALTGSPEEQEDAKANLRTWENIAQLRIAQKAIQVSSGFEEVLTKILSVVGKVLAIV